MALNLWRDYWGQVLLGRNLSVPKPEENWAFPGYRREEIEDSWVTALSGPPVISNPEFIYYLSGPMNGYPQHNFPAFSRISRALRENGVQLISPHEIVHPGKPGSLTREEYLRGDLIPLVQHCRGIIMMPGWIDSWGAGFEIHVAAKLNYEILLVDGDDRLHDGEVLRQYVH